MPAIEILKGVSYPKTELERGRYVMNIKRLLILIFVSLFMSACSNESTPGESATIQSDEASETINNESFIADDITTIFYPEVTNLRVLTTEEEDLLNELNDRINNEFDTLNTPTNEILQTLAPEYNLDADALLKLVEEGNEARFYSNVGSRVITNNVWLDLMNDVLKTNINGKIEKHIHEESGGNRSDDHSESKYIGNYLINGEEYYIAIFMEYSDDFETAELTRLVIDGENIDLN